MTITVTFLQTITITHPEGTTENVDEWRADRSEDSATITLTFPGGTSEVNVQSAMEAWFEANNPLPAPPPPPDPYLLVPLTGRINTQTGDMEVLDASKKPLITMNRDMSGNARLEVVDVGGNKRRVLTPQAGTIKTDTTADFVDVTFDQAFDDHPVVTLTPSKPLPNHKVKVSKTGFTVDFATPPDTTVAWDAKGGRK